ncbi:MAG: hypothetical protein AB2806_08850 [Candidatus Thiodiazotropha sp.]
MSIGKTFVVIQPPDIEPLSLAEAKDHLNELSGEHDNKILNLISSARKDLEKNTGRVLITQTIKLMLDAFDDVVLIPRTPVQSIESITYLDADGAEQSLLSTDYRLDVESTPARLTPAHGKSWPSTMPVNNAVSISFIAGYGNSGSDIEEPLKQAMKLYLTKMYDLDSRVGRYLDDAINSIYSDYCDPSR